jgi:hypothetical protein
MKKAAAMHQKIAGQPLKGPFKHYWGESSRMISTDKPYSLFLAIGIPFEVTNVPASDGWTFLSDTDAVDVATGKLKTNGTSFLYGGSSNKNLNGLRFVPETLQDLFAFKHELIPRLIDIPYVEDEKPVICAWYPGVKTVLLWNLSETKESLIVRLNNKKYPVEIGGLDAELVKL